MTPRSRGKPPARGRASQECGYCGEGRWNRKILSIGNGKPEKHDIAGHVGGEHVPEAEIADRVDGPGRESQREQGERQRMKQVRGRLLGERTGCGGG